jgi:cytochrome c-type biogenesis protein
VLSFLSPCVLPVVPPYLCFLAGVGLKELTGEGAGAPPRGRLMGMALAFVLGFSTVFVALGATASSLGGWVGAHFETLAMVAGAAIVVMGLHFLGLLRIGFLLRDVRYHGGGRPAGWLGAYAIGLAFAFGWTPCVGPVLAAVLMVAGAEATAWRGVALLAAYAAGLALPFLAAALFTGPFLRLMVRFRRHVPVVERVMGAALVATGVLFMTGSMPALAGWLLEAVPALGRIG